MATAAAKTVVASCKGKFRSLGIGGLKGKKETLDFSVDFLGRVY